MGDVYLAEQKSPIKRLVALKLIKAGMDTHEVIARFEIERQALALMDHPYIAKVFDAGSTPEGRPYFVMEYVPGIPITEYCDQHQLSTRDRLELFQMVCEGVQHAHQKAVLHRDLKPANILVLDHNGKPQPRIIDFGVAKATTQKLTEKTMFTVLGQLIGTPEHMSPEQAELMGDDVDTRTDVYALGTVLYELLVGALPFDPLELRKAGFEGIRYMIREKDPLRPSTRLSTLGEKNIPIAISRGTQPHRLFRRLRGELDWIVMRSLEKDRNRRYGSPIEFAQDITRHLNNEPVLAGPPSAVYRTRKFVRRNRIGVSAVTASVVVLIAFATTMLVQSQHIAQERDRANKEAEASRQVSGFLADMLSGVDPQRLGNSLVSLLGEQLVLVREESGYTESEAATILAEFDASLEGINRADLARQLLDEEILSRASDTVEKQLGAQPLIAAQLRYTLGETYLALGLPDRAEEQVLRSVTIRQRELGSEDPLTLSSQQRLASVYHNQLRSEESAELTRQILPVMEKSLGLDHPLTMFSIWALGAAYNDQGRMAESDSLHALALRLRLRVLGPENKSTLRSMIQSGMCARFFGRYAEAESLITRALESYRILLGDDNPATVEAREQLAGLYHILKRYEEAEALSLENLERSTRTRGADHPSTLYRKRGLGRLYIDMQRYDDAESTLLEALEGCQRALGPSHPFTMDCYFSLGAVYKNTNQVQQKHIFFQDLAATLTKAAQREGTSPRAKFEHAWNLLDVVPAEFVDPQLPLRIALEANQSSSSVTAYQLDTLALAYFRAGQPTKAVEVQRRALSMLGEGVKDESMETALERYERALAGERQ